MEKPGRFDEEVVQDGVKVLVDSKALFSIIGSEMDYVDEPLMSKFVFRNPNISELLQHTPGMSVLDTDGCNRGAVWMRREFLDQLDMERVDES